MSDLIIRQFEALLDGESDFIANAANCSAFIMDMFEELNWAGFYFVTGDELLLGPFCGKPACVRIKIGKGVCGASASRKETIVVDDVHEFPGHIACDAASNSEIVVPLIHKGEIFGVLDIDSPVKNRFSNKDKEIIEEMAGIIVNISDIEKLTKYYKF